MSPIQGIDDKPGIFHISLEPFAAIIRVSPFVEKRIQLGVGEIDIECFIGLLIENFVDLLLAFNAGCGMVGS